MVMTIMSRDALLRTAINNATEAEAFIRALHALGLLFHFDDSPDTIECRNKAGEYVRTFTDDEVPHVVARVDELFKHLADPFELAVDLAYGDES